MSDDPTASDDRSYYMVRALYQEEKHFDHVFNESVVGIGYSKVDVSTLAGGSEVEKALHQEGYWEEDNPVPQVKGRKRNEVLHFNSLREGDRIVVPYYSSVALATATGSPRYQPEVHETHDLSNQHVVDYLRRDGDVATVPREELSEALQRRLRVRGSTVLDLAEFANEIEALFERQGFTWQAHHEKHEEERRQQFREQLLSNIRDGQTNLRTGGIGLEHLVCHLLGLEGYEASVLSKREFPGKLDADVKASRGDRFGEQKLLVQVKHHQGETGSWGAEQLAGIHEAMPEKYSDHRLVLVTTADLSTDLKEEADEHDIVLVDGDDLMEWLVDHVEGLETEVRRKLGISAVPELTAGA